MQGLENLKKGPRRKEKIKVQKDEIKGDDIE